jgi:hypothetical protein
MGKRIHLNSPVEMSLSRDIQNQFGSIQGKVISISLFAVSKENIYNKIQNKVLVDYLFNQNSAVIEVIVQPDNDPANPTQFVWTSGVHPSLEISSGTVGDLEATVEATKPIFYLIPLPGLKTSK